MNREVIDKRMAFEVMERVFVPVARDLGGQHLKTPYIKKYDHDDKSIHFNIGSKRHGDKRHRTEVMLNGITYTEGEKTEGTVRTFESDREVAWSRQLDNRQVRNRETVTHTIRKTTEKYNKLRSFSSLDVLTELTVSAHGEIAGFGGSVTQRTSISAHSEIEAEQFNKQVTEEYVEDSVDLSEYPKGAVWLLERYIAKIQTVTPISQWGIWDCGEIVFNLYDWAGNNSVLPDGRHDHKYTFAGFAEFVDFLNGNLSLRYPFMDNYRPDRDVRAAIRWLENTANRQVGPVEWDRVSVNDDVAALVPTLLEGEPEDDE